jgi:hypothetical protein
MKIRVGVVCAVVVSALTGCAAPTTMRQSVDPAAAAREAAIQRKMAIERQFKDLLRVQTVARPILKGSAELCGEKAYPSVGVFAANAHDFAGEYQLAARDAGLGERVQVIAVIPNSPAADAGLAVGDTITAVENWPVPSGKKATPQLLERLRTEVKDDARVTLTVDRKGQSLPMPLQAESLCDYPVYVTPSDDVNAFADGKAVYLTAGMLRFVENDQELALVIGHELAHNAMGHITAKKTNYALGSVFDILAAAYGINTQGAFGNVGAQAYSQGFESEADYVGLYAVARAGIPIEGSANFWRRFGAATGSIKTQYGASHPGTAERFVGIENAVVEIKAKQAAGEWLVPNRKGS